MRLVPLLDVTNDVIFIFDHGSNTLIKAVRIITNTNYLAHSEPIFKTLNLLKLEDILKVNILKFYYQHENKNLAIYFQNIEYNPSITSHHYNTRKHEYVYFCKT